MAHRGLRQVATCLGAAAAALTAAPARADVSSWFFVGGGPSLVEQGGGGIEEQPALQIDAGMGSSPAAPVVVGGLVRLLPHFGDGVDFGGALRTASRGYVQGDWGAALDLGGYHRVWGGGSSGGMATLSVGAPFGVTLGVTGAIGSNDARTYLATVGIDFARLTVYRRSGLNWWHNPFPSPRPR